MRRFLSAICLLLCVAPLMAAAQENARIEIILPAASQFGIEPPAIRSQGLVESEQVKSLIENGFPAHLHFRLERWKTGRWFDNLRATSEWDAVLRFDLLTKRYQVYRVVGLKSSMLGEFADFSAANDLVGAAFNPAIPPPSKGELSYYSVVVEVETLSMRDIDEVERWLRGELKPAIRGQRNPGTAVTHGVGTLVLRLLGGDKRRYEAKSGRFTP